MLVCGHSIGVESRAEDGTIGKSTLSHYTELFGSLLAGSESLLGRMSKSTRHQFLDRQNCSPAQTIAGV